MPKILSPLSIFRREVERQIDEITTIIADRKICGSPRDTMSVLGHSLSVLDFLQNVVEREQQRRKKDLTPELRTLLTEIINLPQYTHREYRLITRPSLFSFDNGTRLEELLDSL